VEDPDWSSDANCRTGCVYLLSTYYARYDMQKRYAFFYLIGTLCNGLSGVLAYGLQQMVYPSQI
jgi:hypothetical protein